MSNFSKIFAALALVFLVILGVKYLSGDEAPAQGGILRENFDEETAGENKEFLRVLKSLETVTLDNDLFVQPAFTSLVDFSIELKEEPKGRPNPFRPIDPTERALALSNFNEPEIVIPTDTGTTSPNSIFSQ